MHQARGYVTTFLLFATTLGRRSFHLCASSMNQFARTRISAKGVPVALSFLACAQLLLGCNALLGNERPAPRSFHTDPGTDTRDGGGTPIAHTGPRTTDSTQNTAESLATGGTSDRDSETTDDTNGSNTQCLEESCREGQTICVFGAIQNCVQGADGCWQWSELFPCDRCQDDIICVDCLDAGVGCSIPPPCDGDSCPALIGAPCGTDGRCDEGRCQETLEGNSVCCQASCDSACQRCSADGQSCVDALDDAVCGTVSCPEDNACRRYTSDSVTANRCVEGTCGAPDEVCPFLIRGEGEECSETHRCDALGNCTVPKLAQGAPCLEDTECATRHCADGVCCENACDGICAECRKGTGKCDVVPEDDRACPDVECSRWNAECTRSLGNVTANHCARLGACKSELSCPIENRPQGTPCAGHYLNICDGSGTCALPTIECGQETCLLEAAADGPGSQCCVHHPDFDLSEPACKHPSDCIQQYGDWSLACDEHADCRTDESMCCATVVNGMGRLECTPLGTCNVFSSPVANAELCESPAMGPVPCSNGGACIIETESLPGFKFCTRLDPPQ